MLSPEGRSGRPDNAKAVRDAGALMPLDTYRSNRHVGHEPVDGEDLSLLDGQGAFVRGELLVKGGADGLARTGYIAVCPR